MQWKALLSFSSILLINYNVLSYNVSSCDALSCNVSNYNIYDFESLVNRIKAIKNNLNQDKNYNNTRTIIQNGLIQKLYTWIIY